MVLHTAFSANATELVVDTVVVGVGAGLIGAKLGFGDTTLCLAASGVGSCLIVGHVPVD